MVVVARADRLVEDGRVGREAGHGVVVHVALDLPRLEHPTGDVVEPEALTPLRAAALSPSSHPSLALRSSTHARATAATRSGVKPNLLSSCFSGADAPKVCMPMMAPSLPT